MHPAFANIGLIVAPGRSCADVVAVAPVVAECGAEVLRGTCGVGMAGPGASDARPLPLPRAPRLKRGDSGGESRVRGRPWEGSLQGRGVGL